MSIQEPSSQEPSRPVTPTTQTERLPFPLQANERVVKFTRRHWWFLWPYTVVLALVAIVPVAIVMSLFEAIGIYDDLQPFSWIVSVIWLGYWGVRTFFNWYRYDNDIWVVTDQRIVDSIKRHPFNHSLATADLINVQDINVNKSGILPTVLGFGDVVCQTAAGSQTEFVIGGVADPAGLQMIIDRERDAARARLR